MRVQLPRYFNILVHRTTNYILRINIPNIYLVRVFLVGTFEAVKITRVYSDFRGALVSFLQQSTSFLVNFFKKSLYL